MIETGTCRHSGTKRQARGGIGSPPATLPVGSQKEFDAAFKRLRESGRLKTLSWRSPRRPGS